MMGEIVHCTQHRSSGGPPCILSHFVVCVPASATKLRTSTLPVRLYQLHRIVTEAARGHTVPEIVDRVRCHEQTAYLWLHLFNTSGFEKFERPTNPLGRGPVLFGPQVRELAKVALSRPADLGPPFTE